MVCCHMQMASCSVSRAMLEEVAGRAELARSQVHMTRSSPFA